jgi:transposase
MTLITGAERRRRWNEEDRARILAAISEPGAVVAEVARAADVCTSLVYKWRREARAAALTIDAPGFAPVVVEAPPAASLSAPATTANGEPGVIVVEMRDARVRIGADAPTAVITATLKALRQ